MVFDGVTVREPLAATLPMPLSKVTEVALEEFHVIVAVCPARTVDGSTATVMVGRGTTVIATDALADPPGPVAVAI